jgi:hypothetical protein
MTVQTETVVPLIFTTHGNIPEADLKMTVSWVDHPDYVQMVQTHMLGDEVVKQSVFVYSRKGVEMLGQQAT